MCGRAYQNYTEEELDLRYLTERSKKQPLGFKPNFNLAPTQLSPVVLIRDGQRVISLFRWGLVPSWAKDIQSAARYSLINARGEEILEKRTYRKSFEQRRCIIPLSGFIEWHQEGGTGKRPYAIHLTHQPIMSVAGVWEHWQSPVTSQKVDSFSILTQDANEFMQRIHDRMPVILNPEQEAEWLDPENQDPIQLMKIIREPCQLEVDAYEISTRVNSPRNNDPELLRPVIKE